MLFRQRIQTVTHLVELLDFGRIAIEGIEHAFSGKLDCPYISLSHFFLVSMIEVAKMDV
jgi:hypothetical protein